MPDGVYEMTDRAGVELVRNGSSKSWPRCSAIAETTLDAYRGSIKAKLKGSRFTVNAEDWEIITVTNRVYAKRSSVQDSHRLEIIISAPARKLVSGWMIYFGLGEDGKFSCASAMRLDGSKR